MDRESILDTLRVAEQLGDGIPEIARSKVQVIGRMFYGAPRVEAQIADITAARLGCRLVDMDWSDVTSKETSVLLGEVSMASHAVDLLLTAFSGSETFGEGHDLMDQISKSSSVPTVPVMDDLYHWQSALAHLLGFQKRLGDLSGRHIAVSWGFGSSFVSPGPAHALLLAAAHLGANIELVAPSEFSLLNRVKKEARGIAEETGGTLTEVTTFGDAFQNADAIFACNWMRLEDFSHPERFPAAAQGHQDWYFDVGVIPDKCVFSQDPPLDYSLMVSPRLARADVNISSSYLSRRVRVLAASIIRTASLNLTELLS
ncbi:MAG: hypothetical protein ACP6KW_11460 [Candidatus Thorarchaeota archaeon]